MSWPARIGAGVAVLAALALGQAVDSALPVEHTDVRPFVHAGDVGDRVQLVYGDITVDAVQSAETLLTGQDEVGTPGIWLVLDVTVVARGRPLSKPDFTLQDSKGRSFLSDSRSGYNWVAAPTGVPWRASIPFEVPRDALSGATLVVSRHALDDRRDDVARIDLGIGPDEAAQLWETGQTVEIPETGMGAP